ncbi:AAA family ATPase [Lapidilactobacillus achengensis]|uniref:AAA family ATPase n=1 Tax=Lapidilactobacillus achengensis TaxID=2486000 RepID=A0ABW1UNT1_9LACO|nr:MoxR family ATPase [Lapidilactobacillus achengensis]
MEATAAKALIDQGIDEIERVIVGKRDIIRLTITTFLANGHVLFEDVPGVGKTTLAQTLAKVFAGSYHRIQFTPDLLPGDITGVSIYNRHANSFEFQQGPIFATFVLADEINRATPRTQSALLEAMGERKVTLDGTTYPLDGNFFVLATQNPSDYEGTYPLPEAQMDRFLMRLSIGYPDKPAELAMLNLADQSATPPTAHEVITAEQVRELKEQVQKVRFADSLLDYLLSITTATRQDQRIRLGVSPRGSLALAAAARAYALTQGRGFVLAEDIQRLTPLVLGHRLILQPGIQLTSDQVLADLLQQIPVPLTR